MKNQITHCISLDKFSDQDLDEMRGRIPRSAFIRDLIAKEKERFNKRKQK